MNAQALSYRVIQPTASQLAAMARSASAYGNVQVHVGGTTAQLGAVAPVQAMLANVSQATSLGVVDLPMASLSQIGETNETDEEIEERIKSSFDLLKAFTLAVKRGDLRALIVSGAPGIGKTYEVEDALKAFSMMAALGDDQKLQQYSIVKGKMSPVQLFQQLYAYSGEDELLIIDDCDSVFKHEDSLNILKAALDTSARRIITYNVESRVLADAGVPRTFEFKGGVIFVTNLSFNTSRKTALQPHLDALQSRCHTMDLEIHTARELMIRIKMLIRDGLFYKLGLTDEEGAEVMEWMQDRLPRLKELSVRTIVKAAEMMKCMPAELWKVAADRTQCVR